MHLDYGRLTHRKEIRPGKGKNPNRNWTRACVGQGGVEKKKQSSERG